jgi:hypothetical protein
MAVNDKGELYVWGDNSMRQFGLNDLILLTPRLIQNSPWDDSPIKIFYGRDNLGIYITGVEKNEDEDKIKELVNGKNNFPSIS